MPSPFPGMDPYIEACGLWGDFHDALIQAVKIALARATPKHYFVRTNERSYLVLVESEAKDSHPFLPDVSVTTPRGKKKSAKKGEIAVAEPASDVEPMTLRPFIEEEHRENFVEIYESRPEQRLVTCIEVLSPANKSPGTSGWEQYQREQSLLLGDVNLVEIDLLRGGQHSPTLDPWPKSPYVLMVAKAKKPRLCKVWRAHFQRSLPPIPIPLAKTDPEIPLRLQPMIDDIYADCRYQQSIDYTKPLKPPLNAEEAAWLQRQLRASANPA